MLNVIVSLPKTEAKTLGVNLDGVMDMLQQVEAATRISYEVHDNGNEYVITSDFPNPIAEYALAQFSFVYLAGSIIEEQERFDAIVRCN